MKINKLIAHSNNFTKGRNKKIEFLVIHYTANNGDTAKGNCNYFQTPNRNASAHYFVDEKEVWQSVEDNNTAWHCGTRGTYYHDKCRNDNSIGIELCSEKDNKGNYYFNKETINNAIELTKMLMKKYNIPITNIVRHYDVTRKICPAPFVNNSVAWNNFKESLIKNHIDANESSKYIEVKRNYKYNNDIKSFNVINKDGENYIRIVDLANLLKKDFKYDNNTKITELLDIVETKKILINNQEQSIKCINSNGSNYLNARDIGEQLGYEVGYNENLKQMYFKFKDTLLNKIRNVYKK